MIKEPTTLGENVYQKNHFIQLIAGLAITSFLAACSDSGSGGAGGTAGAGDPAKEINFEIPISPDDCHRPFFGESDLQKSLQEAIQWGDAPCVKKLIELGAKADAKIPSGDPWDKKTIWPLHYALQDSPLFFAGSARKQGFEVLKVLAEAGSDPNLKNDEGETALQVSFSSSVIDKHPAVTKYLIQSKKADLEIKDTSGNTPLLSMLVRKNKEFSEFLVANGASVQVRTRNGESTLQFSVENRFEELAIAIVNRGVDPSQTNGNGDTTLHRAVVHKLANLLKLLLSKDLDLNKINNAHQTAFFLAVENNANEIAKDLMAKGADVNLASLTESPIHAALLNNNDELSSLLIPLLKDPDVRDSYKNTPLILATRYASSQQVRSLLSRGANADLKDGSELTALMYALSNESFDKISDLAQVSDVNLEGPNGETALFFVKNSSDLQTLINLKADINHRSKSGQTPVSKAVHSGLSRVAVYLISTGANIDWRDSNKSTLLHLAIAQDSLSVARALLARGVDSNSSNVEGKTPIFLATSAAAVDLLIENRADINHLSSERRSALLNAVVNLLYAPIQNDLNWALVERLLKVDANPNIQDKRGQTPLHMAAFRSLPDNLNLKLVALLLEKGAGVNTKDAKGNTALHLVNSEAVAHLLLAANPDLNIRNLEGRTAREVHQALKIQLENELPVLDERIKEAETFLAKLTPGTNAYQVQLQNLKDLKAKRQQMGDSLAAEQAILALL
jgi:ankyrin repeat protein